MQKSTLAQGLRQRRYPPGSVPAETIDGLSDNAVINRYVTCPRCGKNRVTGRTLKGAIALARNADHFLALCDQLGEDNCPPEKRSKKAAKKTPSHRWAKSRSRQETSRW